MAPFFVPRGIIDMTLRGASSSLRGNGPMRVFQYSRDAVLQRVGDVVTLARCRHQRPGRFAIAYGDDLQAFG